MAFLGWWLSSLATSMVVGLQAPPSSAGGEPVLELSGNSTEREAACGAPSIDGVAEELEALGLTWPRYCSQGRRRERKTPVVWIHLHKAAGSTMCALAKLNGERVVWPRRNCNWFPYDDMGGRGVSCQEREQFFKEHGTTWAPLAAPASATWAAIERPLADGDFCPGLDYAVLLRDPAALALSAVKYHLYTVDDVHKSLSCVQSGDCRSSVTGVKGRENKGGRFQIQLWYYMDNFVVRTLGGEEAMEAPPGQLQQRHYDRALEVLKRMKVVLLLEELGAAGLSRAFGWSNLPDVHEAVTHEQGDFSAADVEAIKRLNPLDYRLYDYIRSIPMPDRVKPVS